MRLRALFGSMIVCLLVATTLGSPAPARAIDPPFCLLVGQQCESCGWDCEKLCTYYECDDGSMPVTCGGCNCIEQCVVP
jgi:hypothetical protein